MVVRWLSHGVRWDTLHEDLRIYQDDTILAAAARWAFSLAKVYCPAREWLEASVRCDTFALKGSSVQNSNSGPAAAAAPNPLNTFMETLYGQ